MISVLQVPELNKLIPLAKAFIAESTEDIPFNEEHFIKTWEQVYLSKNGSILKYEKDGEIIGALGYLVYPDFLSGELKATETFWFIKPEFRGCGFKLLDEFEKVSKELGVKRIMMAHLKHLMPDKLKSVYLKRGYREIETQYEKVV